MRVLKFLTGHMTYNLAYTYLAHDNHHCDINGKSQEKPLEICEKVDFELSYSPILGFGTKIFLL